MEDVNSISRSEKKKKKRERKEAEMEEENTLMRSQKKKKKKRKRELVEEEEEATIDVKIEKVSEQADKIAPLVGYFPSGFNPHKTESQVRVFRNSVMTKRLELVVNPKGSKTSFVGTNYTGEALTPQVCSYSLGILDKETRTLKIVPFASNKIFRMEPKFKEPNISNGPKESDISKTGNEATNAYGTKKARVKTQKAVSNRKETAETQEYVDEKVQKVVVNKDALKSADAYTPRNIPPHNITATEPEKAYPLNRIISEGDWDSLVDVLNCVQSGNSLDAYPSFVRKRAKKLMKIKDPMERDALAGILSYITHLVKFKDQKSKDHSESVRNHRIPAVLYQKFATMFTDEGGRFEPTQEKKNLLISYVLVLSLIADGYRTDPTDIGIDLRLSNAPLRDYFENLGCKYTVVDKLHKEVILPLPLVFPASKYERRRR